MRLDNEPRPWNVAAVQTWPGSSLLARGTLASGICSSIVRVGAVKLGGSDDLLLESCEEQSARVRGCLSSRPAARAGFRGRACSIRLELGRPERGGERLRLPWPRRAGFPPAGSAREVWERSSRKSRAARERARRSRSCARGPESWKVRAQTPRATRLLVARGLSLIQVVASRRE